MQLSTQLGAGQMILAFISSHHEAEQRRKAQVSESISSIRSRSRSRSSPCGSASSKTIVKVTVK